MDSFFFSISVIWVFTIGLIFHTIYIIFNVKERGIKSFKFSLLCILIFAIAIVTNIIKIINMK